MSGARFGRSLRVFAALLLALTVSGSVLLPTPALAATNQLSGKVTDQSSNPIVGATIAVIDPSTSATVTSTTTDSSGNYSMSVGGGTYNIQVTPPSGSMFQVALIVNRVFTGDTLLDVVLVPAIIPPPLVTVSGRILDPAGNGVPNQTVGGFDVQTDQGPEVHTDATGYYAFQTPAGTPIIIAVYSTVAPSGLPHDYLLAINTPIVPTQDTEMNITLPAKRVEVHVQDPSGNPISGASVSTNSSPRSRGSDITYRWDAVTDGTTDATGVAILWVFPSTYSLTASATGWVATTLDNVAVTTDTSLTITLTTPPPPLVTVSGRILDPAGNGVPNQTVGGFDVQTDQGPEVHTDATGYYAFQTPAGTPIIIAVYSTVAPSGLPHDYLLAINTPIVPTQDTEMNITLPAKRVEVHVQDPSGNPISGASVSTNSSPRSRGSDITYRWDAVTDGTTDATGVAILWVFPSTYSLTIAPPDSSPFAVFTLPNNEISSDITTIIVLQFVHAPPVTTATTSPQPNAQGVYPGTVTVALSATATSGFTVANTYFTIDGGTQQTYSAPFTVSGEGSHTVTYWSVDNAGVYEIAKTLPITIESLTITTTSPLPDGTIGVPYTAQMEATGGTLPYHWSISSGQLPDGLTIDPDTGEISGTPTTAGTFGFTVQVTDNSQITATKQFALAPPPSSGTGGSDYTQPVSLPAPPGSSTPDQPADCASGTYHLPTAARFRTA